MVLENQIIQSKGVTYFCSSLALDEYVTMLEKIAYHMSKDIAEITGVPQDTILGEYRYINDYDPIREILKKKGKWDEDEDISSVLKRMRKLTKHS